MDGDDYGAAEAALEADGWIERSASPYMTYLGPIWTSDAGGTRAFAFVAQSKHANMTGVVHGGMLASFADHAMGLTVHRLNNGLPQVTIHLGIDFVAPARIGDVVRSEVDVVHEAGRTVFLRARLLVAGKPVAAATGVFKKLRAWPKEPPGRAD